jgi:glycosyltransferase involved in cell wall biosynthesis
MAADTRLFQCSAKDLESRRRRILSGQPLRILYVGTLSARKGIWDIAEVLRRAGENRFRFTFVGAITPEAKRLFGGVRHRTDVRFVGKRPEAELQIWHSDADVFLFPTLEDGFAVTLAQAIASGLPVVTSTNCSGPDLVTPRQTGFVVPPRSPDEVMEVLDWCDGHRQQLADMCDRIASTASTSRTWDDFARDFEEVVERARRQKLSPDHVTG